MFEIEIRFLIGKRYKVLRKEVFDDWNKARNYIAWFNWIGKPRNSREYAEGPWPVTIAQVDHDKEEE